MNSNSQTLNDSTAKFLFSPSVGPSYHITAGSSIAFANILRSLCYQGKVTSFYKNYCSSFMDNIARSYSAIVGGGVLCASGYSKSTVAANNCDRGGVDCANSAVVVE
ncbi:Hypothetical predicted protein [Octopus vulgaris]|uniref:Uncharacterized protein n=1 Tax=Octopus vulgaris TaxID=6645 RepID=A0AA36EW55_OCTVU|nr:Hypothetical predicted protein [Octopus vulgaris]